MVMGTKTAINTRAEIRVLKPISNEIAAINITIPDKIITVSDIPDEPHIGVFYSAYRFFGIKKMACACNDKN
tara:strand:+ start:2088 stop:2303 length:216 start_codon:yes stop_codon:yes gene_type:complete